MNDEEERPIENDVLALGRDNKDPKKEREGDRKMKTLSVSLEQSEIDALLKDTSTDNKSDALRIVLKQWKEQRSEIRHLREENAVLNQQKGRMRDELMARHREHILSYGLELLGILGLIFLILFLVSRMHGG